MANTSDEQKLESLESEIARLRLQLDGRLGAIADELRRAEARDEWIASHLRETRRDIHRQNEILDSVRTAVGGVNR